MSKKHAIAITVIIGSLTLVGPAYGALYSFYCITNNNPANAAIGEAQLSVNVTDASKNQVMFTYTNSGPEPCSITDVYVDDGSILGLAQIFDTAGSVEFTESPTPANLPGANNVNPPFEAIRSFSADSDSPILSMGVNPGESLAILYDILPGQNFWDVIGELRDGSLRLGLHVQGFTLDGGSEAFVNIPPPNPVPEPMTLLIMVLGSIPMIIGSRSRR